MSVNLFEGRRPGISAIYNELKAKHQTWSHHKLLSAAKEEWHRRNAS